MAYINYDEAIEILRKHKANTACDILETLPKVYAEEDPIDVPAVIKAYRLEKHLTQRELSDRAGISRQTGWNVERANHGTTVYTFERLLRALGYEIVIAPIRKK